MNKKLQIISLSIIGLFGLFWSIGMFLITLPLGNIGTIIGIFFFELLFIQPYSFLVFILLSGYLGATGLIFLKKAKDVFSGNEVSEKK